MDTKSMYKNNTNKKFTAKMLLELPINELEKNIVKHDKYVPPNNEFEKGILEIWSEILKINVDDIGIDDNFLNLGGDSLKATNLISKLHKKFNVEVSLIEVFNHPTVRQLAEYIILLNPSMHIPINKAETKETYPLSSAQKRMYIINQMNEQSTSYNIPIIMNIEGEVDKDIFTNIFVDIIKRHESLRTAFEIIDGKPVQKIYDNVDFKIQFIEKKEDEVDNCIKAFIRPFKLSEPGLIRVMIIKLGVERFILAIDIHHIIADGLSLNILIKEFVDSYNGKNILESNLQYKDFSEWQNKFFQSEEIKKQEKYWLDNFKGRQMTLKMPLDYKRSNQITYKGKTIPFEYETSIVSKMNILAKENNTTMNILISAVYMLLLSKYSGQDEIVLGSLVAGRRHADLENIIGMFANFLPIKGKIESEHTFLEFLDYIKHVYLHAYENQDYPFEKIVEQCLSVSNDFTNPLFNTMLIFHNEFSLNEDLKIGDLVFSKYKFEENTSKLDFKIDLFYGKSGKLKGNLEYNINYFKESTMNDFINKFKYLLELVINNPKVKISNIEIFNEKEKVDIAKRREQESIAAQKKLDIVVSATFTAEPIEDYIRWWLKNFNIETEVKFAPYNQVFQQLMEPNSIISTNKGVNLLLIRFEDWIRNDNSSDEERYKKIRMNFRILKNAILNRKKDAFYFIAIFPISTHLALSTNMINFLNDITLQWIELLQKNDNINIIDFRRLDDLYFIEDQFDKYKDNEAHIPFTDEYIAAIGTMVSRKINSWTNSKFKVIALDCDNTLWEGICGEDGALGVRIDEPYIKLQKFMLEKFNEGMLLVLCSKNNENDVWRVFEENPNMVLRREHFVCWEINWNHKSENLKRIAQELNLGLDSFIYIDDSGMECIEVMMNCQEVLTLQLPENMECISDFLNHVWAFDKLIVTEEDKNRTNMYIEDKERKKYEKACLTIKDYLSQLGLKVSLNKMKENQVNRVAQLTQRTNQFNLSTIRRSDAELIQLNKSFGINCWVVDVSDNFGDYGISGVIITKIEDQKLFLDTFLLSCRVLGRNIENAILMGLRKYCEMEGIDTLIANYYSTDKNKPVKEFFEKTNWSEIIVTEDYVTYMLPIININKKIDYIDFYYGENFEKRKVSNIKNNDYILDHIAVATLNLDKTASFYKALGYTCDKPVEDPLQNSKLMMCKRIGHTSIELVVPIDEKSPSKSIIDKIGEMPYHLCYRVSNIESFLEKMNLDGIDYEIISNSKEAILFGHNKVIFIYIKDVGLIELLEDENYHGATRC